MNIPTPAALKARLDAKMKDSESSTKEDSPASRSSLKGKGSAGSSSRTSRQKPSTSSQENIRGNHGEASQTTENSRPKNSRDSSPSKKPFVRPKHLTQKPLQNNDDLLALKKSLEKPARGQFKREYHVGGRRSGKQTRMNNKETN